MSSRASLMALANMDFPASLVGRAVSLATQRHQMNEADAKSATQPGPLR